MRAALIACATALCLVGADTRAETSGPDMAAILAQRPAPTLAAYRLFTDARAQTPAAGVTPYDLATPLFSDYAVKARYVFTPRGAPAHYSADDVFAFPVGAVLIKTFAYPADFRRPQENVRALETRLLIHKASGWTAQTYVWNADGTEARLQVAGAQIPVHFIDAAGAARDIQYAVPNKNQCKGCHAHDDALTPIGPRARNLDRRVAYDGAAENQIARWSRLGVLADAPADAHAAPGDTLEDRARAYLDVNCAHCHNPHGPASNSGLDLRFTQREPIQWGVRKRPVAAGRASADLTFAIDPGHPERSILLHRMESTDPGVMMPELGRTIVHEEGVDLVRRWIAAMDADGRIPASHKE